MQFLKIAFLLFAFTLNAQAKDWGIEGLLLWKLHPDSPAHIIPLRKTETKISAAKRYLHTLQNHPELRKLFINKKFELGQVNFEDIKFLSTKLIKNQNSPSFLVLSNNLNDLAPDHRRPKTILKPLKKYGADVYFLAPAAEVGLSRKDAASFRSLLIDTFDALLAIGGDDVHPHLYGEQVTHAHLDQINLARDKAELRLIRAFSNEEKGVTYGICRGSQLCAVEKGERLIQDLKEEQKVLQNHWFDLHKVKLTQEKNNLLTRFLNVEELTIFSVHHQAVKAQMKSLIPIAFYGEGSEYVVEGWQYPNNLGFGLQFHPELYEDENNDKILKGMVEYAKLVKDLRYHYPNNCTSILKQILD